MAIVTTKKIQIDITTFMSNMLWLKEECLGIYNAYWDTDANTSVSGLASGSTGATVESKLTKDEYTGGITFVEDLDDFFTNSAVTQTDYLATCNKLKYGSANITTEVSNATEALGTRLQTLGTNCTEYYRNARDILNFYTNNELGDLISSLDNERVVPGSEMTVDDLSSGIALVEQFKKMMNNESVTTASYEATIAKWQRF
jgi:hypothetical protein